MLHHQIFTVALDEQTKHCPKGEFCSHRRFLSMLGSDWIFSQVQFETSLLDVSESYKLGHERFFLLGEIHQKLHGSLFLMILSSFYVNEIISDVLF